MPQWDNQAVAGLRQVGPRNAYSLAGCGKGQRTLRITIHEDTESIGIKLEGRVAGVWAAELGAAWARLAPRVEARQLTLDLRGVTFADDRGKQILSVIQAEACAAPISGDPFTQFLAQEIVNNNPRMKETADGERQ